MYDVCIVGSGPAAHTAAVYTARANLSTIVFEGWMAGGIAAGGQLTTTSTVENFPGFPDGITGAELCERFRAQSVNNGAKCVLETVVCVEKMGDDGGFQVSTENDATVITARAVIVATGAVARRLDIEGGDTYWNAGISACAVCDGAAPIFRNKAIAVVGGGDTAMEEALYLTKYASKVYIVHRSYRFRASRVMQERVLAHPKIEVLWSRNVVAAHGGDNGLLTSVRLDDGMTLEVGGLFYAIGHVPASGFIRDLVDTDAQGYIVTPPGSTKTSVPGIFAAGDVQDKRWRQAITAAGSGCMAALEVEEFLHGTLSDD